MKALLYTDLDGTMLDHANYSPEKALPGIRMLEALRIPIVFCSSKTFREQRWLQQNLNLEHPFIFETGSAIAVPENYFPKGTYTPDHHADGFDLITLAHSGVNALRQVLSGWPGLTEYENASTAEVMRATGLSSTEAIHRAKARMYTVTLIDSLTTEQAKSLEALLRPNGFKLSRGGRFYTVLSAQTDKGTAIHRLNSLYRCAFPEPFQTYGVGDSPNDLPMFDAVDQAFLVQQPRDKWADMRVPGLKLVQGVGPAGWMIVAQQLSDIVKESLE
jgi:mannosyl-3-phosphoglycerate phosphatase family protein